MLRLATLCGLSLLLTGCSLGRPLASWTDGPTRTALIDFVERTTQPGSPDFVPVAERVAVFDNDGTLWAEQPAYVQLLFALDRVKDLAPEHPEWKTTQPFQAVLEDDLKAVAASGHEGLLKLLMATHAGMSTEEFADSARTWLATARHPQSDRLYTDMVYQPMLELLTYMRANGYKTFIVSGGGVDFLRVFAEEAYGIPPEQIVGSSISTRFVMKDNQPTLQRLPEIDFIDDKAGKPVGIHKFIGRRPHAAFGNSDGDLQMLQWTHAGRGARLSALVHHTDADREWAYDRDSHIGRLDKALDEAGKNNWLRIDMTTDWQVIFPPSD